MLNDTRIATTMLKQRQQAEQDRRWLEDEEARLVGINIIERLNLGVRAPYHLLASASERFCDHSGSMVKNWFKTSVFVRIYNVILETVMPNVTDLLDIYLHLSTSYQL